MAAKHVILIIMVVIGLPFVNADSGPYTIPLEGSRWVTSTIKVHVAGGQAWQRNETLQALQLWNEAQLWFAAKYFPNSSVYTFKEGDRHATVQVILLNTATVVGTIQGWTDYSARNGIMESAKVQIGAKNTKEALLTLSLHELGHVLGIGHVTCCMKDLMNAHPVDRQGDPIPTTLDLYAVHVLATSNSTPTAAYLPSNIPYETVPELAAPEFPNFSIILILVIGLIIIRKRVQFNNWRPRL